MQTLCSNRDCGSLRKYIFTRSSKQTRTGDLTGTKVQVYLFPSFYPTPEILKQLVYAPAIVHDNSFCQAVGKYMEILLFWKELNSTNYKSEVIPCFYLSLPFLCVYFSVLYLKVLEGFASTLRSITENWISFQKCCWLSGSLPSFPVWWGVIFNKKSNVLRSAGSTMLILFLLKTDIIPIILQWVYNT